MESEQREEKMMALDSGTSGFGVGNPWLAKLALLGGGRRKPRPQPESSGGQPRDEKDDGISRAISNILNSGEGG